jgi:TRAP-type C4-dicarboxylate transport system permease small subunit
MHMAMAFLARKMAILGGIVLGLLILLVCISVAGRTLNGFLHTMLSPVAPDLAQALLDTGVGPINGDFELVEAGIAFAIFAFLPLCQITGGHATVDIFTNFLPLRANRGLRMVTEIVFAAVLVLIAWRLFEGMLSKMSYGETTFLLQFPIWWAYAASFAGAVVAALVGVYTASVRSYELFTGQTVLTDGPETDH